MPSSPANPFIYSPAHHSFSYSQFTIRTSRCSLPAPRYRLFAASGCRFYCPREAIEPRGVIFFPLPVAVLLPFLVSLYRRFSLPFGKQHTSRYFSSTGHGLRVSTQSVSGVSASGCLIPLLNARFWLPFCTAKSPRGIILSKKELQVSSRVWKIRLFL